MTTPSMYFRNSSQKSDCGFGLYIICSSTSMFLKLLKLGPVKSFVFSSVRWMTATPPPMRPTPGTWRQVKPAGQTSPRRVQSCLHSTLSTFLSIIKSAMLSALVLTNRKFNNPKITDLVLQVFFL